MMKFIGKPYAGKPHVRIDEGAGRKEKPPRSTLLKKNNYTLNHGEGTEFHRAFRIECQVSNSKLFKLKGGSG